MEAAGAGSLLRKLPETNTHGWEDLGIIRKPAQVSSTGFSAGSELLTCCCIGIFQGDLEHAGIQSTKSLGTAVSKGTNQQMQMEKYLCFQPSGKAVQRDERADSTLLDPPDASSLLQEDCRLRGCQAVNFHLV